MPSKGTWKRIDRCIYRNTETKYLRSIVSIGPEPEQANFDPDTSLDIVKKWRDDTTARLRGRRSPTRSVATLRGDITRYITAIGMKEASQLRAWLKTEIADLPRRKIKDLHTEHIFKAWERAGVAPRTLRQRRQFFQELYRHFDGATVQTPVDTAKLPPVLKRRPEEVPNATILKVYNSLLEHERIGHLRDGKTRARYMVQATCHQRPASIKLAEPGDLDLLPEPRNGIYGIWRARAVKDGEAVPVYLNQEQAAAWSLFIREEAWGDYDTRSFARVLKSNGWTGPRPYNLRHSGGITLSENGVDLGDIQHHLGHTDISTTRTFYVPKLHARQQHVSQVLDGRFGFTVSDTKRTIAKLAKAQAQQAGNKETRIRKQDLETRCPVEPSGIVRNFADSTGLSEGEKGPKQLIRTAAK